MSIDAFSVLLFGFLVKVLLGVLFLAFSLQSRRAIWFKWWSATFFLGSLATVVFLIRGFESEFSAVGIAVPC
jgi:hypothetical protein